MQNKCVSDETSQTNITPHPHKRRKIYGSMDTEITLPSYHNEHLYIHTILYILIILPNNYLLYMDTPVLKIALMQTPDFALKFWISPLSQILLDFSTICYCRHFS